MAVMEGASYAMDSTPMQYTAPTVVEDTPVPTKLQDDHIELAAFYHGLNFTDNYLRLGIIRNQDFPVIMGSECTGIIARIGANVHDLQEGDRVLCLRMHAGLFRRSLHVPRKYCYRLDDHVSLRNGLALGLNFVVAHTCLFELGRLKPGQVVFMTSVGGGVGTSVVQLARTVPNVTVMGTASESKHESAVPGDQPRLPLRPEFHDEDALPERRRYCHKQQRWLRYRRVPLFA
ncbi:synaptic vesicle membrane protein VAT-1 homolog-like isoform X2 [Schistocerca gregaria]|uniref:synaptic vesicle membrane protein VAT-1 homolog-like isoform X2 n=1 Tax=Schistocerca gregaria TaxID=7010 RepID=UPI00211EB731|nr:synaptic vesicle membrane protein VAT-1 homolog-like isoform X2 [Schistocerca gregaria]